MTRRWFPARLFWWAPAILFVGIFLHLLGSAFPWIGHDFELFFQYLIEGRWHVAHYGFSPLRYAVHLCGGIALYGHPNDYFYSLLQLLALVLDPWISVKITLAVTLLVGYAGWFLFGRDVVRLERPWAHVLALGVSTQGFVLMHVMAGHVNFFPFPLLGALLWLLFSPDGKRLTLWPRAVIFALFCAAILYAAGYFVLLFCALLTLLLLPPFLLLRRETGVPPPRVLGLRFVVLGVLAAFACASKLVAIQGLMQVFPRTMLPVALPPDVGVASTAFLMLWAMPQEADFYRGLHWWVHEYAMTVPVIMVFGLIDGIAMCLIVARRSWRAVALLAYGVLLVGLCLQFVAGSGPAVDALRALPLGSALRVTTRFAYIFGILACIAGAAALQRTNHSLFRNSRLTAPLLLCAMPALFFFTHRTVVREVSVSTDYRRISATLERLERSDFRRMPVTRATDGEPDFLGTTGGPCSQDALYGWQGGPTATLVPGPVDAVENGFFNLANPACYAYPAVNGCAPGDAIAESDRANFENFRTGGPLTWKIPRSQRLADALTLATLIAGVLVLITHAFRAFRRAR